MEEANEREAAARKFAKDRAVGNILNLRGAQHFKGTFFIEGKRNFLNIKRALLYFLQILGTYVSLVPPSPAQYGHGSGQTIG